MPVQIRLHSHQLADLAAIARLSPDRLIAVARALENKHPLRFSELHRLVTGALGGDESSAHHLLRPVLALNSAMRQRNLSIEKVFEGLEESFATEEDWNTELRAKWNDVKGPLQVLFAAAAVTLVSKATDLAFDYANLFQGARIITDIRPVYDKDATKIDAAVISYTLRLHYDNRAGDHSLSVALDESDVRLLREQCDRALRKARLAQSMAAGPDKLPTMISGTDNNA